MKKFSFNSIIRKQQPKGIFIDSISKSWHWHLSISIVIGNGIAKKIFAMKIFFKEKVEYLYSFLCLVMVSVLLCYKYLILYDFLFIKSKASIGVLEKSYLNIRKHLSCPVLKKQLLRKILHTLRTFQWNIQRWVLCSNFLIAKCKRYLHFLYMQFIYSLQIHGMAYITCLNM